MRRGGKIRLHAGIFQILRWLGGMELAVCLIGVAAVAVAWGTYLESKSQSHLFAASAVYGHPAFTALLLLFFVNILFSALRRWPFKRRHVPFLLTHLGLLFVLAGTMAKQQWGLQGVMVLDVDKSSQQVTLPHQFSLFLRRARETTAEMQIPIDPSRHHLLLPQKEVLGLYIRQMGVFPHAKAKWHSWIHGDWAHLIGFPSFRAYHWTPQEPLPDSYRIVLQKGRTWHTLFLKTDDFLEAKKRLLAHQDTPALWILHNHQGETLLLAAEQPGQIVEKHFSQEVPEPLIAYEGGVLGYGAQAVFDFSPPVVLETPVFVSFHPQPPLSKREEQAPALVVELEKEGRTSRLFLGHDVSLRPLVWPALGGEYLVRFGNRVENIPYRLRLKEGRQIFYPDSSETAAYEADLWIEKEGTPSLISLAMNRVFETEEGYRFYLSGMSRGGSRIQRVTLVVNRDPFKYYLTYPGAIVLVLGSLWLFFFPQFLNGSKRPK